MNELIPVASRPIGGEAVLSANARELHEYLAVETEFKDWMPRRIDEYGFEEGKDFCSFLSESTGGRRPKEYIVSLDMAKELAMVERSPKGKEARMYFIECERKANNGLPAIPASLPEALRLAADMAEKKQIAEAQRDEAIRTKAQIGNKREATAMATASAAAREAAKLRDTLGFSARHATIIAVENQTDRKFGKQGYQPLRKYCKTNGLRPEKVHDPRWGVATAWPAVAWKAVYGINLQNLFPEAALEAA